jgi:hypothetical protein
LVTLALVANPASHAWFGGRSQPKPLPQGSIASLRWGRPHTSSIAQPSGKMSVVLSRQ